MSFDKNQLAELSTEEKRILAFELLDSIDEEFVNAPVPDWKRKLIQERVESDIKNTSDVMPWSGLRKKYFGKWTKKSYFEDRLKLTLMKYSFGMKNKKSVSVSNFWKNLKMPLIKLVIILIKLHILRQMQAVLLLKNFLIRLLIEQMKYKGKYVL